jgi:hypothetical protein
MEKKPQPPPQFPIVPLRKNTTAANMVVVSYGPGSGGILLQVAEVRDSAVEHVGEKPVTAIFEVGRFALTPRALRQMFDATVAAVKAYEDSEGHPLPTQDAYIARGAMPGLLPPASQEG